MAAALPGDTNESGAQELIPRPSQRRFRRPAPRLGGLPRQREVAVVLTIELQQQIDEQSAGSCREANIGGALQHLDRDGDKAPRNLPAPWPLPSSATHRGGPLACQRGLAAAPAAAPALHRATAGSMRAENLIPQPTAVTRRRRSNSRWVSTSRTRCSASSRTSAASASC